MGRPVSWLNPRSEKMPGAYNYGKCKSCIIVHDDVCAFCIFQPELADHYKKGKTEFKEME
jgi:hypothetical protein